MRFPTLLMLLLTALSTLAISGCASIISDSKYPVAITSSPTGAAYEITNESGISVHSGVTPDQVTLNAGAGFFDGEEYRVKYQKDGYSTSTQTLETGIDGWYWGNILFGGVIGLLIIDPATGAMFSLPERVDSTLKRTAATSVFDAQNSSLALVSED